MEAWIHFDCLQWTRYGGRDDEVKHALSLVKSGTFCRSERCPRLNLYPEPCTPHFAISSRWEKDSFQVASIPYAQYIEAPSLLSCFHSLYISLLVTMYSSNVAQILSAVLFVAGLAHADGLYSKSSAVLQVDGKNYDKLIARSNLVSVCHLSSIQQLMFY